MKTSKRRIVGLVVLLTVAVWITGAETGIRSAAQSTKPASNTKSTNVMSEYLAAVQEAIVSGTAATNLTEGERSRLMNESIKTDLAAQLWFRQAMSGRASDWGLKMVEEIRVLESLRAGRTNDAIRQLEESLDRDIMSLVTLLRAGDETKSFKTTRAPLQSLQGAREYREKFPRKTEDPATDERVKDGLSYGGKK